MSRAVRRGALAALLSLALMVPPAVIAGQKAEDVGRDSRGRIARSTSAKNEFKREQPCPSTGKSAGACPGHVIDHVKPLCKGGADKSANMQWQTKADAKAKDKVECR